jgi:pimeloyl-ACP methyl ester carboxylesterase
MARKTLLACGILSSVLYAAMVVLIAKQWEGYSSASQSISELSAIGAPTRPLWTLPGTIYVLLVTAFGGGVWMSAGLNRALRRTGVLIVAYGALGLLWPLAPMHSREVLAAGGGTPEDTMHVVLASLAVLLMFAAIASGAVALGPRFRRYSIASVIVLLTFGLLTFIAAPRVSANLPTPWLGVWQRINLGVFLLWVVVLAVALLRGGYRTAATPAFVDATGRVRPGSIAEAGYRRLGNIDQWVMIRGENVANPVLIVLHGGPGFSETSMLRYCNASLEKSFTVVYWDQRGAGRSFSRRLSKSTMTVAQLLADLDELVDAVRARLGKDQVILFGHSWGSALGALYAARFPDKVAAYVGSAQIGDWQSAEAISYAFAVAEAERVGNRKALRALRAIGPPPYGASAVFAERTSLQRLDGQLKPRALWEMGRIVLGAPESSIFDLPGAIRGFRFTLDAMWTEVSALNLTKLVPALKMPVFFFVGDRDHWVPPETTLAYFDVLAAPSKKLVRFAHSGHEQFVDEPEAFNRAMLDVVRPVAAPVAA